MEISRISTPELQNFQWIYILRLDAKIWLDGSD